MSEKIDALAAVRAALRVLEENGGGIPYLHPHVLIALRDELAALREYRAANEELELLLSNATWTAEAQARLTAARAAVEATRTTRPEPVVVVDEERHGYRVRVTQTATAWAWSITPVEHCACDEDNESCEHGGGYALDGTAPERSIAHSMGIRVAKMARHMTSKMDW